MVSLTRRIGIYVIVIVQPATPAAATEQRMGTRIAAVYVTQLNMQILLNFMMTILAEVRLTAALRAGAQIATNVQIQPVTRPAAEETRIQMRRIAAVTMIRVKVMDSWSTTGNHEETGSVTVLHRFMGICVNMVYLI